jgi:lysophospholipase L1-like esterase
MTFIDIVPHFLGQDGKPRAELYVADGVHFSSKGYAVVARLLREKVGLKQGL